MKTRGKSMKYVSIARHSFVLEPRYYFYGWSKSQEILARPSTVHALVRARSFLPKGYNFKVWDGRRVHEVQMAMLNSFWRRLCVMHPKFQHKKREELLFMFGGRQIPPRRITELNTHRNGGALDLTIVDSHGNELYMGTDHDDLTKKAALDYYEGKQKLTPLQKEARKSRRLLKTVMTRAGFEPYPSEWWHWGYGK